MATISGQAGRRFWPFWACLISLTPGLAIPGPGEEGSPALVESEFSSSMTGGCKIEGPGVNAPGAGSSEIIMSWLGRHALGPKGWYCSFGAQAENFFFPGGPGWPGRLQDYAALVSLEYFQGTEKAAALTVRPGWYFENHPSSAAWDVPVDLAAGFPLTRDISGVLGFNNGRFYHHPLPIFGFVWAKSPRTRLEMVFPEPALVMTLGPASALRLGGELVGGGFLGDPRPLRTVVEYTSYRVGAEWSNTWPSGFKLTLGGGVETVRNFDLFREQRRLHGSGAGYLKISATYSR